MEIGKFYAVQKRRATHFEAQKLCRGLAGSWFWHSSLLSGSKQKNPSGDVASGVPHSSNLGSGSIMARNGFYLVSMAKKPSSFLKRKQKTNVYSVFGSF